MTQQNIPQKRIHLPGRAALLPLSCTLWTTAALAPLPLPAQSQLTAHDALYARLVRLTYADGTPNNGDILATVTSFNSGNHVGVYRSTDDGGTFTLLSRLTDPDFAGGLCCGTLFELPQAVGDLPSGTLLWAGSVGQNLTPDRRMQIKVYISRDAGKTWTYRSHIVSENKGGLWEPEFALARDGALVMFFSDESHPAQSQIVNRARTYDGMHWQDLTDTVATTVHADRPGMPIVNRLAKGTYFMTFERCGPAACSVAYKTSPDGWNWGDPTDMGTKITTQDGHFVEHAPTHRVLADGSILLVGQTERNADGTVAAGNGQTLFRNLAGDPARPWTALPAPVPVAGAYDNYCPNYSSPLLPVHNGSAILEFASHYSGANCLMFYAIGPL